jgi:hypothetical protein
MGGVAEVVNVMIGIMRNISSGNIKMVPITACSWKNFYKRKFESNVSKELLSYLQMKTMHEGDAILIACYWLIKNCEAVENIHQTLKFKTT